MKRLLSKFRRKPNVRYAVVVSRMIDSKLVELERFEYESLAAATRDKRRFQRFGYFVGVVRIDAPEPEFPSVLAGKRG